MITWNSTACLAADPIKAEENAKLAEVWIRRHQFIILPEAHFTEIRLAVFLKRHQQFLGWGSAFGCPERYHSTGGLLILANRRYVEEHFLPPECTTVVQGRGLAIKLVSKAAPRA
jgi:hypothetical protein